MIQYLIQILGVALLLFITPSGSKAGSEMLDTSTSISDRTGGSSIISPDNHPLNNLFLLSRDAMGFAPHDFILTEFPDVAIFESLPDTVKKELLRGDPSYGISSVSKSENLKAQALTNPARETLRRLHGSSIESILSKWSWYAIAQCQSLVGGDIDFSIAVTKNVEISEKELSQLIEARKQLYLICKNVKNSYEIRWTTSIQSKAALEFLVYLQASAYFYDQKWLDAANKYKTLLTSSDTWVKEVAHYMFARALINQVQRAGITPYGNFSKSALSSTGLTNAREALDSYLANYPDGYYAASATGLIRRILWLQDDIIGLAEVYEKIVTTRDLSLTHNDMFTEISDKILSYPNRIEYSEWKHLKKAPAILAVLYLEDLNTPNSFENTLAFEQTKMYFSSKPDLFVLLLAYQSLYRENNAQKVLELIPELDPYMELSSLQFSMQALRGMALSSLRSDEEEDFWIRLLKRPLVSSQRAVIELWLSGQYN